MFNRIGAVLLLFIVLSSACGGCVSEPEPWTLGEEPGESTTQTAREVPRTSGEVTVTDSTVCDANREHIRKLGIVDEATLQRRPTGEVVEIWADWGADGVLEGCSLMLFDESGAEVVNVVDHDSVPGPQRVYWKMDYDRAAEQPARTLGDTDGDGVWDYESTAAFDARGNTIWSARDDEADGTIELRGRFYYDERGHRTRQEHDDGDDGVIDRFTDFVTDEAGRYVQWDEDHDADGRWDRQLTWTYDEHEKTYLQVDHTNGTREFVVEQLDGRGRIVRTEADDGDDGTVDYVITVEWEEDTAIAHHDFDADGTADNTERHTWYRVGDELKPGLILDDYESDGTWDQIRDHVYDDDGRLIYFQYQDPATGELSFRQTYVRS